MSGLLRILTIPFAVAAGLTTTAVQIGYAGASQFAVISLVSTLALLLPFADLGLGAAVTTALARQPRPVRGDESWATVVSASRRLLGVTSLIVLVSTSLGWLNGWPLLLGVDLTPAQSWAVSGALALFGLSVPLGLGLRILVGSGRAELAALIPAVATVGTLLVVLLLVHYGSAPILLSVAAPAGALVANGVAAAVALTFARMWAVPVDVFRRRSVTVGLLAGSAAMLVINIGLPVGLQTGRLLLAHLSTLNELAQFSLMSQLYGVAWSIVATMGLALWPIFVRRRSNARNSLRILYIMTVALGTSSLIGGVSMVLIGPLVAEQLSGGDIRVSFGTAAAFGALLVAQALHLPSGMLLTYPRELWWQAKCVGGMALMSLVVSISTAAWLGAVAIPAAAATSVFLCQVLPDFFSVRRLLRERESFETQGTRIDPNG